MKKRFGYPFTPFFLTGPLLLFGGSTAWRFTDLFYGVGGGMNAAFILPIACGCILWLAVLFLRGDKLLKRERRTREKNFRKKVRKGKKISLIAKLNVPANSSLVLGALAVWLLWIILFPFAQAETPQLWSLRGIALAWLLYGVLFSFPFRKNYLTFRNGLFYMTEGRNRFCVAPGEIAGVETVLKHPQKKSGNGRTGYIYKHIRLRLADGREILFRNADTVLGLKRKLRIIGEEMKADT